MNKTASFLLASLFLIEHAFGNYQAKVLPILQKKCMACHTQTPEKPFFYDLPLLSYWTRPYVDEKLQRAIDSFEIVSSSEAANVSNYARRVHQAVDGQRMPPSGYLLLHPERRVTEAERELIADWASSSGD